MERKEFEKCCQAIEDGVEVYLENTSSHETGRVLFCTPDQFRVEVAGKRQAWQPENCEESSSSTESPHGNL